MSVEYAIVVKNKTRLESLIERFNTKSQARFYMKRQMENSQVASQKIVEEEVQQLSTRKKSLSDKPETTQKQQSYTKPNTTQLAEGSFEDFEAEHEMFHEVLNKLQSQLSKTLKYKLIERAFLPSFLFSDKHLVIVIGQDGLVANTAKYARSLPLIAVNPDKKRYDGVLLPFEIQNFMGGVENVLRNQYNSKNMQFAEAKLNDGQRLLAFNDLFIGAKSHVSARYRITYQQHTEEHSSSGIIVSTPAGATGWLSSIFNMAYGVAGLFEKDLKPRQPSLKENELLFAVREPFKSVRTQAGIATGRLNASQWLEVESLMPANGFIFSDGVESDFLHFNSGTVARIGVAPEEARLVLPH